MMMLLGLFIGVVLVYFTFVCVGRLLGLLQGGTLDRRPVLILTLVVVASWIFLGYFVWMAADRFVELVA